MAKEKDVGNHELGLRSPTNMCCHFCSQSIIRSKSQGRIQLERVEKGFTHQTPKPKIGVRRPEVRTRLEAGPCSEVLARPHPEVNVLGAGPYREVGVRPGAGPHPGSAETVRKATAVSTGGARRASGRQRRLGAAEEIREPANRSRTRQRGARGAVLRAPWYRRRCCCRRAKERGARLHRASQRQHSAPRSVARATAAAPPSSNRATENPAVPLATFLLLPVPSVSPSSSFVTPLLPSKRRPPERGIGGGRRLAGAAGPLHPAAWRGPASRTAEGSARAKSARLLPGPGGRTSTPAKLKSACCAWLPAAAEVAICRAVAALNSFAEGPAELELALEEELELLAAGERPSEPGEHPQDKPREGRTAATAPAQNSAEGSGVSDPRGQGIAGEEPRGVGRMSRCTGNRQISWRSNFLCYSPLPLVCVDSLPGMKLTKAKYP
ncbi:uncharacterized protein ACBT57_010608 [Dama dama]